MLNLQIDGYRIIRQLGKGGMCTVYYAEQLCFEDPLPVAIKVLAAKDAEVEQLGARFLSEANIAARLKHPNIVEVIETGQVDGNYWLSMEYLEGGDLRALKKSGIELSQVLDIVIAMADAIDYASSEGVIHRDIKPGNVMFRGNGSVVIVDFGIARDTKSNKYKTDIDTVPGTPVYMSPEQCAGQKLDKRSDLYSVGVVLYELLAGQVPFDGENAAQVVNQHITAEVPPLPEETSDFQNVIDIILAKNPDDRYQTGADFIDDIEALREELPEETRTTVLMSEETTKLRESYSLRSLGSRSGKGRSSNRRGTKQTVVKEKGYPILSSLVTIVVTLSIGGLFYWFNTGNLIKDVEIDTPLVPPPLEPGPEPLPGSIDDPNALAEADLYIKKAQEALSEGLLESAAVNVKLARELNLNSLEIKEKLAAIIADRERLLARQNRLNALIDTYNKLVDAGSIYSPASANAYVTLDEIRSLEPQHHQIRYMQSQLDIAASGFIRRLMSERKLKLAAANIDLLGKVAPEKLVTQLSSELDDINRNVESARRQLQQLNSYAQSLQAQAENSGPVRRELITTYQRILQLDPKDKTARVGLSTALAAELEGARRALEAGAVDQARDTTQYLQSQAPDMSGLSAFAEKLESVYIQRREAESERVAAIKILDDLPTDFRTNASPDFHRIQATELIQAYRAIFHAKRLYPALPGIDTVTERIDREYSDRFYAHANKKEVDVASIYAEVLSNSGLKSRRISELLEKFDSTLNSLQKKNQRNIFPTF